MPASPFEYQAPAAEQLVRLVEIRNAIKAARDVLTEFAPDNASRDRALRKLQEVELWASRAIVLDGQTYLP